MRYALVRNGKVENVAVVNDDASGRSWLASMASKFDTTIDVTDHKTVHGYGVNAGDTYTQGDGFLPVKPFASWVWDKTKWVPPVPYPTDGGVYEWDESVVGWEQVSPPPAS